MRLSRQHFFSLMTLMLMLCMLPIACQANQALPLRPEKAFKLSVKIADDKATISADWVIAPGYYLYVDRMHYASEQVPLVAKFPKSQQFRGPDGLEHDVFANKVNIPIVLQTGTTIPNQIDLVVKYQGCAKNGFCYPPMKKVVSINMATRVITYEEMSRSVSRGMSWMRMLTDHNKIKVIFSTEHVAFTLLVFFILGVLLAFTPCVLPMLPILTGIIVGEKHLVSTKKAFLLSLTYVLGVATAYACAGILATMMGSSLQVWMQQPIFIIVLSAFLVLLGLSLFEFFDLPVSRRWQNIVMRWSARHQGGTYIGVYLMGIFSTLIVSPCITAPMIGVLLYIAQTGNMVFGASALFIMGLGMGVPLIIVGMSAGRFLPKSGPWMRVIVKLFGLILIGMAIWLIDRLLPAWVTVFIWGLFALGTAMFMCLVMPDLIRHRLTNRLFGMLAAVIGVALMLNAIGVLPYLDKWTGLAGPSANVQKFITVHSTAQLQDEIAKAASANKPVLVDFYADWCEACVVMDKEVFDLDRIQALLRGFVLIRVDLTENTNADQALMKQYNVIAPPTILFFATDGKEVKSKRIVGGVGPDDFSERVHTFITFNCDKDANC